MLVSAPIARRAGQGLGLVLTAALTLVGCKKGDPEQCTQAQTVVRTSLDAEDFASARQWREYAYKQCEDQSVLPPLDQAIVDKESGVALRKAAEEKRLADTNALAKVFFEFVAQNRAAPDRASAAPVCDPPAAGAPPGPAGEESKERLCTATRQAGTHPLEVRYYAADLSAFRFTTTLDGQLDCKAIGATTSKQWDVAAVGGKSAKRSRCNLGGALQGLIGVVTAADKAPIYVVSPNYLAHDPGWRVILEGP